LYSLQFIPRTNDSWSLIFARNLAILTASNTEMNKNFFEPVEASKELSIFESEIKSCS
jgi:hypothetical protein